MKLIQEDSDNSDFEKDDEYTGDQINVTNQMIDDWTSNMQSEWYNAPSIFKYLSTNNLISSLEVLADVVRAFQSAIVQLHGNDEQSDDLKYHFAGAGRMSRILSEKNQC
jgi:hypothetical protein